MTTPDTTYAPYLWAIFIALAVIFALAPRATRWLAMALYLASRVVSAHGDAMEGAYLTYRKVFGIRFPGPDGRMQIALRKLVRTGTTVRMPGPEEAA